MDSTIRNEHQCRAGGCDAVVESAVALSRPGSGVVPATQLALCLEPIRVSRRPSLAPVAFECPLSLGPRTLEMDVSTLEQDGLGAWLGWADVAEGRMSTPAIVEHVDGHSTRSERWSRRSRPVRSAAAALVMAECTPEGSREAACPHPRRGVDCRRMDRQRAEDYRASQTSDRHPSESGPAEAGHYRNDWSLPPLPESNSLTSASVMFGSSPSVCPFSSRTTSATTRPSLQLG